MQIKLPLFLSLVAGAAVVCIALKVQNSAPWIYLTAFFLFAILSFHLRQHFTLKFWVNGMFLSAIAFLGELYFQGSLGLLFQRHQVKDASAVSPGPALRNGVDTTADYFWDDWNLGFRPKYNVSFNYTLYNQGQLVYQNQFHLNTCGHRFNPKSNSRSTRAALFFGDSFSFGLGVNDDELYSSRFEEASHGSYRAINLAFQGYAINQVVRQLELGAEHSCDKDAIPAIAFYLAHIAHVRWSAGLTEWDNPGPRYELDTNGDTYYAGQFKSLLWLKAKRRLERSSFLKAIMKVAGANEKASQSSSYELKRFVALCLRAKAILAQKYGAPFVMIYWETDGREQDDTRVIETLRKEGIRVFLASEIFPSLKEHKENIVFMDGHPRPQSHQLLANYLLTHAI